MSDFARPRLLVSVRSVEEALAALAGGTDIIDVKEPIRGSLGRPDAAVLDAVNSAGELIESRTPLSVALGEVHETRLSDVVPLPRSVQFAKLGLSRLWQDANWLSRWIAVRDTYDRVSAGPIGWIAVIYADTLNANSPPAEAIIAAAASSGCAGVLVDTFSKTEGRLLESIPPRRLARWARGTQDRRMMFAIAGRLAMSDLPRLVPVAADVIAVRSAVCQGADRQQAVCSKRVEAFKHALESL